MGRKRRKTQPEKLLASAWVDREHRAKWEFIEKRLGRAMTPEELKAYVGYVDSQGKFRSPKAGWYAVPPGYELSEANGDEMPEWEREKLLELRVKAKRGVALNGGEQAYCARMYRAFPSAYPKDEEVFEKVKAYVNPLGGERE